MVLEIFYTCDVCVSSVASRTTEFGIVACHDKMKNLGGLGSTKYFRTHISVCPTI